VGGPRGRLLDCSYPQARHSRPPPATWPDRPDRLARHATGRGAGRTRAGPAQPEVTSTRWGFWSSDFGTVTVSTRRTTRRSPCPPRPRRATVPAARHAHCAGSGGWTGHPRRPPACRTDFTRSRSAPIFPPTVRASLGSLATCNRALRQGEAASAGSADLLPSAGPTARRRASAGRQGAGSRVGQRNGRGSWRSRLREMERRMSSLISPSRYSWESLSRWARTSS
jgi:hypothetical protein